MEMIATHSVCSAIQLDNPHSVTTGGPYECCLDTWFFDFNAIPWQISIFDTIFETTGKTFFSENNIPNVDRVYLHNCKGYNMSSWCQKKDWNIQCGYYLVRVNRLDDWFPPEIIISWSLSVNSTVVLWDANN